MDTVNMNSGQMSSSPDQDKCTGFYFSILGAFPVQGKLRLPWTGNRAFRFNSSTPGQTLCLSKAEPRRKN
jgi:hypothetical protein